MEKTLKVGIKLNQYLEEKKEDLRGEDVQIGLKNLEDALVQFKEAHSEVLSQLISKVQKDKGIQDKEQQSRR